MRIPPLFVFLLLLWDTHGEDARIKVDAAINGHQVRFVFDTGANESILFRTTVERLHLKINEPPPDFHPDPGAVALARTEPVDFTLGKSTDRMEFGVLDVPSSLGTTMQGILSWRVFTNNVLNFDWFSDTLHIGGELPSDLASYRKFNLLTNQLMGFVVPGGNSPAKSVYVDTGDPGGVALQPAEWEKWVATQTNQPATMMAFFTPVSGLVLREERWAKEISIGSLVLKDVPVRQIDTNEMWGSKLDFGACLGLVALQRLDVVIDGPKGVVYARPTSEPVPPYEHSRIGAVFTPNDLQSDPLFAHVITNGPAYLAGIRNHDELLMIDYLDMTDWRSTGKKVNDRFRTYPSGTTYGLTLKRNGTNFQTTVVLKNLLGPELRR